MGNNIVNFFKQPSIEAALLTALLGAVLGFVRWYLREWWTTRQKRKPLAEAKSPSPKHQLPSLPTNFIGREEEIAKLENELVAKHPVGAANLPKHIVLHGIGGVGKTALATVLAHRLKKHFPDAQLCLDLHGTKLDGHSPVNPADAMQSIIRAFRPEARLSDRVDRLTPIYNGILNDAGRVLLFLDDAADAEQIKPLLPPANCLMLVTSRTRISLPGMTTRNIDCLRPEKSEEFLLKLAPRIKGHEREVAELCGYLPLAMEISAGVVESNNLYSVPDLLERLRKQPGEISKVDATFQTSYNLLNNDSARCLRLLAIFPGDFGLTAATAVWELPQNLATEVMQKLMISGWVEYNEANGRFRLHNLVRQFGNRKLNPDEQVAAELRCARFFQGICDESSRLFENGGQDTSRSLEIFDRERKSIEMVFEWLQSRTDGESAALLVALLPIMRSVGNLRFHPRKRLEMSKNQLRASELIKDRKAECISIGNIGVAHFDSGDIRRAMEFYNQALAISRQISYSRGIAASLGNLGRCYRHLGEIDKTICLYEEVLQVARSTGMREEEGGTLNNLGETIGPMGNVDEAVKQFVEALSIAKEIGSKRLEAAALANLGIAYSLLDDIHRAISYYEQALIVAREICDRGVEGFVLMKRADAYGQLGDSKRAVDLYDQALLAHREIGDLRGEAYVLNAYSVTLNNLGDRMEAIAAAEKSFQILEAIEDANVEVARDNLTKWRNEIMELSRS